MRILTRLLMTAVATALLAPGLAHADAVRVQFSTKVAAGQRPKVIFTIQEPLDELAVELTSDDGQRVTERFSGLGKGATREVLLQGDPGKRRYSGTLTVAQGGQRRENTLTFEAVVSPSLEVQIDKSRVDVAARRLEARLSRPAARAVIKVFSPGGAPAVEAEQDLGGQPAGAPLVITWPAPPGSAEVARIDLTLHDVDGFFTSVSLFPWSVYIPHEEVNFATDSAAIARAEAPKLEASYGKVADALARHRDLGPIKLYIAGHTDTVGNAPYNVKLSQQRAQAIALWFRKRGLRIPIAFEGFGEHALLVATADGTDEPRNRRVDYILAVEDPAVKTSGFRASWKRLP